MDHKRLIVIGGGAAGFFCAVNAARLHPSLEVLLLEKSNKLLSKVKVSGGGRCNVTHACFSISEMIRRYPRGGNFLKKAFHHFFTTDTIDWYRERGVRLVEEPDGRMFPAANTSQAIIDCLLAEADRYKVSVRLQQGVESLARKNDSFVLQLAGGNTLTADYVCVACGGYPKSSMFDWLRQTGHAIEEPVPSLFTVNMPGHPLTQLMGISMPEVQVKLAGSKLAEKGPVLITHWGLSGPAILRLSAWGARELASVGYEGRLAINWLPAFNEQTMLDALQQLRFDRAAQKVVQRNGFDMPQRLWQYFVEAAGIHPDRRWADLPAKEQARLAKLLCAQEVPIKGKTTFKEEFVTAGGISLSQVDPHTMQSRLMPGLFFAGEILDVDGITGGFNFQHAWTSGFIAAQSMKG